VHPYLPDLLAHAPRRSLGTAAQISATGRAGRAASWIVVRVSAERIEYLPGHGLLAGLVRME
jgi:hypothetical protein